MAEMNRRIQHSPIVCKRKAGFTVYDVHQDIPRQTTVFSPFVNFILVHSINNENICVEIFILLHEKFLQFEWLRAVVFQLNLKHL